MAEEIKTLNELGDAGVVDKPDAEEISPVKRVAVRDELGRSYATGKR